MNLHRSRASTGSALRVGAGPTERTGDPVPRPLPTPLGLLRLTLAAVSAVAIQRHVVDPVGRGWLDGLDLPLALAGVLVVLRPTHSVVIGLVFGLVVDANGHRLFGIHCLAYATLGPVAAGFRLRSRPAGALRRSLLDTTAERPRGVEVVVWVAVQAVVATAVVVGGQTVGRGSPPADWAALLVRVALWSAVVALPLAHLSVAGRRSLPGHRSIAAGRRRSGPGWSTRSEP